MSDQIAAWREQHDPATVTDDVPWVQDTNRADKGVLISAGPRYDASQVLALAVGLGVAGEPSAMTTERASAFKKWIEENDQSN